MKTINKQTLTKLSEMGFTCQSMNNVYTMLHKKAMEGIIVNDTNVDSFAYIDGERVFGEASSDVVHDAFELLIRDVNNVPTLEEHHSENVPVPTQLNEDMYAVGNLQQSAIDNHPGTIAALLILQNTPDELVLSRKGQGGKMLSYVEGSAMTQMANFAFLYNWSVKDVSIREDDFEFSAIVICEFVFTEGHTVTKSQIGSANKKYSKTLKNADGTAQIIMIGDTIKSAITDGTKKCMSSLGICQDVYSGAHKAKGLR